MEKDTNYAPIMSLPSEIINMIFENIHYTDIIKFGLTCKHFNELVSNNQYLWKEKVKNFLPNDVFSLIESRSDGNWFGIFKSFYKVKKQVYHEIIAMSAKYFSRVDEIKLEDVRMFFNLALADNLNYYYVTYILQDVIKQAYKGTENNNCKKPFTLTEVFYAKAVLRYLVQTFLTVKWVQAHLKKELYPEIVLNFFTQWMDPLHFHLEEDVEEAINSVVDNVNALLPTDENSPEQLTIPEKINKGIVTQKQVLHVISQVLYQQMRMATMTQANLDTLDIKKVINNKCGNAIAAAVVYYSIAMKCGVHCELIAFPHHLILQWQNVYDTHPQLQYKIVLDTGELIPKGRCPFSNNLFGSAYKYCPDSLLQYIVSAFLMTKGLIKDWYTQNSSYLLDFLSTNPSQENPYRNFLPYLLDNTHLSALSDPIDIKAMSDAHIEIIQALSYLNPSPPALCREITVKHRDSNVKYAIGMLCYHKKYDYMCVIRGWSLCCAEKQGFADLKTLRMGGEQPFYNVIAVDQSSRYVAQENITEIGRPTRVYHLEDVIAKEFTHFDGFCYVPNSEKEKEYPEDAPIREIFRARAELRA